jgi:cation:H+ antiporter
MVLLSVLSGLVLLLLGGEALVRGSVAVARRLGLSPLLIGITLVGFGTSMPELVASVEAARQGSPAIAIANVVGSNIANTLLILGTAAVLAPLPFGRDGFRRDIASLATVTAVMTALIVGGSISRVTGAGLVAGLAAYTFLTYVSETKAYRASAAVHARSAEQAAPPRVGLTSGLVTSAAGIAAVLLGAKLLVGGAIEVARQAHVSEAVIGVTLVAIGTSLPELVTSIVAALRGHSEVAYGNVVGSNVFNILGIAGVTATLAPIQVPAELAAVDVWVMAGAIMLLAGIGLTRRRLGRPGGFLFLASYGLYILAVLGRRSSP